MLGLILQFLATIACKAKLLGTPGIMSLNLSRVVWLRELAVWRLLTNNLADWHRTRERTGFAAATRVYGHHVYAQQVPGCQILNAVAVAWGQVLVSSNPVCCWRNKEGLCVWKKSILVHTSLKFILA